MTTNLPLSRRAQCPSFNSRSELIRNKRYDAAGNVLTDGSNNTSCSGNKTYAWNAEEQTTCAYGTSYTYDGDGLRVEKNGGASTPTLYWGGLAESDLNGNITSEYILLDGKRIARRDVSSGNIYYYFQDMLGSSNVVATSAGGLENESDFYPFGGEKVLTQNLSNQKFKFTGNERDTESGNDDFTARYYGSVSGRFLSPDIVGGDLYDPQSLNRYAYVLNNPLRFIDSSGFDPEEPDPSGSDPQDVVYTGSCLGPCSLQPPPPPPPPLPDGPIPDFPSTAGPVVVPDLGTPPAVLPEIGSQVTVSPGSSIGGAAQTGLDLAGMIPGPVGMVANLSSAGMSLYNRHYGAAALSLAFAIPVIGQFGADARGLVEASEAGYSSFKAFKAANIAEKGMQWHHIVGQTPGNLARFGPGMIHNAENLVQVPEGLHIGKGSISAYYSSKDFFTGGQTVRKWLAPQSFEAQRDFGLQQLRRFGIIP